MVSLGGFDILKQHKQFQYIYKKGKSFHVGGLVLFYYPQETVRNVGFTATKKVGNAVKRNRSKRRLRALFLKYSSKLQDGSYVFVAKQSTPDYPSSKLDYEFQKVLSRAKIIA